MPPLAAAVKDDEPTFAAIALPPDTAAVIG
jgi:hypothetical protein